MNSSSGPFIFCSETNASLPDLPSLTLLLAAAGPVVWCGYRSAVACPCAASPQKPSCVMLESTLSLTPSSPALGRSIEAFHIHGRFWLSCACYQELKTILEFSLDKHCAFAGKLGWPPTRPDELLDKCPPLTIRFSVSTGNALATFYRP